MNAPAPLKIFIGYDQRQTVAYTVLQYSLLKHARRPISITPLVSSTLPALDREALTPFAYSRFLVPWLCQFQGWAVFMDLDMLVTADVGELFDHADDRYAVMVVNTHHKFERASMMPLNCGHPANRVLTPEYVREAKAPHQLAWIEDEGLIGFVPHEWNFIVGTDVVPNHVPKLIHYTQGIPLHPETTGCTYSKLWLDAYAESIFTQDWHSVMGHSVWSTQLSSGQVVPRLHPAYVKEQQALSEEIDKVTSSEFSRNQPSPKFIRADSRAQAEHQKPPGTQTASHLAHLENIAVLTSRFQSKTVLEYGSNTTQLDGGTNVNLPSGKSIDSVSEFWHVDTIHQYSDVFSSNGALPDRPVDGVISIGYLQYCDRLDLGWILREMFSHAERFVYVSIPCYPATGNWSDGNNPHQTVRSPPWWEMLLKSMKLEYPRVKFFAALTYPQLLDGKTRLMESHATG